jgi:uncharacterized protein YdeI (YjbR/CyaY-like superfamily)
MPPRKAAATAAPHFFATPAAFRRWLERHGASTDELVVGFYKVGSDRPSITWPESVDEALCFGWIDGVRKRIDEQAYQIRFTPRRHTSIWSAINIARVAVLTAEARMTPAGLDAFARRKEHTSAIYAYERAGTLGFTTTELAAFRKRRTAWAYYEALPPGYRHTMTYWVVSAKRADTRMKRLTTFIEACAAQRRMR